MKSLVPVETAVRVVGPFCAPLAGVDYLQPPELSGKQGDTLLGFSVRELSSGRMGAFGLFGTLSRVAPFAGRHRPFGTPKGLRHTKTHTISQAVDVIRYTIK
jgi:hypothetical protein